MKSKIKVLVALVCALAVIGTGTFAWGQIMTAKNEFWGRHKHSHLHDDYDHGKGKKDVYVENTGDTTIYVRVKLDETMNIGSYTPISDWVTHTHEGGAPEDCGNSNSQNFLFHDYFTWTMGGQKWYMPATSSGSVVNDTTEYTGTEPGVKQTANATAIITAAQFLAMSESEQKAFTGWIYSTDGYAYWSQPLPAGEATGLLLHWVEVGSPNSLSNKSYYYAINVLAEVTDRADAKEMWINGGDSVDGSPKQSEETSSDGKDTIWIIIGPDSDDGGTGPAVSINGGNKTVAVGEKFHLAFTVTPGNYANDKDIIWSTSNGSVVDFDDEEDGDGYFIGLAEGTSNITITIGEGEDAITATITVTVTDGDITPDTDLPVNPGPFTPIYTGDPANGDGFYAKADFQDPTDPQNNAVFHNGAIHLEDIITDGNYTGVSVTAQSPYTSYISIGNDHHGKPSVIYSYFPGNSVWWDQALNHPGVELVIPVQVTLTRGDQSATVTINMIYPGCVIKPYDPN